MEPNEHKVEMDVEVTPVDGEEIEGGVSAQPPTPEPARWQVILGGESLNEEHERGIMDALEAFFGNANVTVDYANGSFSYIPENGDLLGDPVVEGEVIDEGDEE